MTGHPIRRPSRWEAARADLRDREHREVVAAVQSSKLPPLTDAQIVAFTGAAGTYVMSTGEATAHAWATGTAASWHDADGVLIVSVDESGTVVARGPGRWP